MNYEKSIMFPINTPDDKTQELAATLGCAIGSMPLAYLRPPPGLTKQRLEDFEPIL